MLQPANERLDRSSGSSARQVAAASIQVALSGLLVFQLYLTALTPSTPPGKAGRATCCTAGASPHVPHRLDVPFTFYLTDDDRRWRVTVIPVKVRASRRRRRPPYRSRRTETTG